MRNWRGLMVDSGLKDEWLERMNAIPGIAIRHSCEGHVGDDRVGGRYPNLRFQVQWEDDNQEQMARALAEFNHVQVDGNYFQVDSRTERAAMSDADVDAWWDRVLSILEQYSREHFARGTPGPGTTVEDLEREIIEGGASVFTWKARTSPLKRSENIWYYNDFTPESWNETVSFFRELERLNGMRLNDVFLQMAARQGIMDLPNTRKWFGSAAAEYGIAHFTPVNQQYIKDVVIPDWVDFLEGPYSACVFWSKNPAMNDRFVALVANQAEAIHIGINVFAEDQKIFAITGRRGCQKGTLETALKEAPAPEYVDQVCRDSMTIESLLDFLVETIRLPNKELLHRRLKETLADCFQAP